jgi:predicted dehydrogenase
MYTRAVTQTYAETAELVGVCDTNEGRRAYAQERVRTWGGGDVPGYAAQQFDRMIAEHEPDTVIVTTKDCYHHVYICRAMALGCDVITEKPMTTEAAACQRIVDTQARTGRRCTVTFNYRYSPPRTQVKALLMSGVIGDVISVDFHWMLDIRHGADYFRRWHRNKVNSGGLMVHKATHHFDLVNWWLSSVPTSVFARGQRRFYTPETAERYGLTERADRCRVCPETACRFRLDIEGNPGLRKLYLDNEQYDGYIRDRCVFSDLIDIEDSVQVIVAYASGARMSYSLNAFMPWEGYTITFNGTRGRLEHKTVESSYINADGSVPGQTLKRGTYTQIFPHFGPAYPVELWTGAGGHGGGDHPLLEDLFGDDSPPDPYMRAADQRAGAYSILTGVAANRSMASGGAVRIADLVHGLELPDVPPMPSPTEPLSFEEVPPVDLPQPSPTEADDAI